MSDGDALNGDGMAGRLLLVVDDAASPDVQRACAEAAARLAERAGLPVSVAMVPITRLDAVNASVRGDAGARRREYTPSMRPDPAAPMSAAPFLWTAEGRPDWGRMWTSFCELALYGGPPHRGPDRALRASNGASTDGEMLAELRRGIWETTGLYAEPGPPGWLAITCESPTMAAWLCAAIILENVEARVEEDRLLLPAGPSYTLTDEVKSLVTVVAKTHHYWQAHVTGGEPA